MMGENKLENCAQKNGNQIDGGTDVGWMECLQGPNDWTCPILVLQQGCARGGGNAQQREMRKLREKLAKEQHNIDWAWNSNGGQAIASQAMFNQDGIGKKQILKGRMPIRRLPSAGASKKMGEQSKFGWRPPSAQHILTDCAVGKECPTYIHSARVQQCPLTSNPNPKAIAQKKTRPSERAFQCDRHSLMAGVGGPARKNVVQLLNARSRRSRNVKRRWTISHHHSHMHSTDCSVRRGMLRLLGFYDCHQWILACEANNWIVVRWDGAMMGKGNISESVTDGNMKCGL